MMIPSDWLMKISEKEISLHEKAQDWIDSEPWTKL
jgi:hypothetical protein